MRASENNTGGTSMAFPSPPLSSPPSPSSDLIIPVDRC